MMGNMGGGAGGGKGRSRRILGIYKPGYNGLYQVISGVYQGISKGGSKIKRERL